MWTHFPLHPDTPAEGVALETLFAGRGFDIAAMQARMKGLMAEEGLPYGERSHTYNSRLAQELGKWADAQGKGDAFHDAIFHAYFVDGDNIGDVDRLVAIAERVGLPKTEAQAVLADRSYEAAVDADWKRSRDRGVTGVPTFAAKEHGVVGAQPYEALEKLVETAGATLRGG